MGKSKNLTQKQKVFLDQVEGSDYLKSSFYFTGGTALSTVYLQHRYSVDIDLFSETKFDNQIILTLMEDWGKKLGFDFSSKFVEVVYIFNLTFKDGETLKVDFAYHPYRRIEKGTLLGNLEVDSLLDISINKLFTISQRTQVKDFVDLYFLLEQFTVWDLMRGVEVKFNQELEPFVIASDFLKVNGFEFLPEMIKPLSLEELKNFFNKQAKALGIKSTA